MVYVRLTNLHNFVMSINTAPPLCAGPFRNNARA